MPIFVSYAHNHADWVHQRLIPVLRAAGGKVLVDTDHFKAGQTVIGQMDELQGKANRHILVINEDYVASEYCRHEMKQAVKSDPDFAKRKVIVIRQDETPIPAKLAPKRGLGSEPLYVDLREDEKPEVWTLLLSSCDLSLKGIGAPSWLYAHDQALRYLQRGESVNLVVKNQDVCWRSWFDQFTKTRMNKLKIVDLGNPATRSQRGLIGEVLKETGLRNSEIPEPPEDVAVLASAFEEANGLRLALQHFHFVAEREGFYDFDLFNAFRWLIMDAKKLVLLAHSDVPIANLFPPRHQLSAIDFKTVELG
jgi:nitroreductase